MKQKQAGFKAKRREGVEMPTFQTLGERMSQGGKYSGGAVVHGLDGQMNQGTKGYHHPITVGGRKDLQDKMGQ